MDTPIESSTFLAARRKSPWRTIGLGIGLFLLLGTGFAVWWNWAFSRAMHDVFTGKTGPVSEQADWPRPLKKLLNDSGGIEINESAIQVHCLCGGVYDKEFVWRMDAAPGLFELLEKRWKLTPINGPDWGVLEGYASSMTRVQSPAWWSPQDDDRTSFYTSPRGAYNEYGGDLFLVAVNEGRSTIFVYFRYKF